jgi:hypothetical protein
MATGMSRDLQNAAEATKEQARAAVSDATDSVRSSLTQQKDGAASSLGSFAGALRKAAKESGGEGQGVGRMAEWAADGLERVSSTLRSKDLDGMLREVQSFARQQPVAFFATAVAAGFLATRFLKAGTGPDSGSADLSRTESRPQDFPPSGAGIHPSDVSSDIPF